MPGIGAVTVFVGFMIYASPSKADQFQGKIIMFYGMAMIATVLLPTTRSSEALRWAMMAPTLLFLGYCALKNL